MVETQWLGSHTRHRVICSAGHDAAPVPSLVNKGGGLCRTCAGNDTKAVERAFRAVIAERGGTIVEPEWLGAKKPHRVICAKGHLTTPTPSAILSGTGCIVCAGKDQGAAWDLFRRIVAERGGEVLEPRPLGVNTPHRIRCSEGHETRATPSYVRVGGGHCHICSPNSTVRAERQFRDLVAVLGGKVVEPVWLGNSKPHRVICSQGHKTTTRPNGLQQGRHLCRICSGHDSPTSWNVFQAAVAKQGGTVIEPEWLGNKKLHRVICREGHKCTVLPNNVQQGSSICRTCAYKVWDVFYVVVNDTAGMVKFGITSHDPRSRLRHHRGDGFDRVVKTITGMADAQNLERAVLAFLQSAGVTPVRGREYYGIAALPAILAIVDNWESAAA
jgi:hypothetical protein